VILSTQEAEIRKIEVQDHIFKNPSEKRVGGMAQVLELLPSKCEILSSNPSTTPPKK
jgi:hypothetical protein